GVKIDFVFRIGSEAFLVVIVGFSLKPQFLIHLADDKVYSSFAVAFFQQVIRCRQVANHAVIITRQLVEVGLLQEECLAIRSAQFCLLKVIDRCAGVAEFAVFGVGADQVDDGEVLGVPVFRPGIDILG